MPMDYLMAPLTGPGDKLIGYAYVTSRLSAASETIVVKVRNKLPSSRMPLCGT